MPSAIGNTNFSPVLDVNIYFALSLRAWSSDASNCPRSSTSATRISLWQIPPAKYAYPKNIPGKTFLPNWWSLDWSFTEIGNCSTNAPNGKISPLNGSPNRLSKSVLPSVKGSWTHRWQQHSTESAHQFSSKPNCNSYHSFRNIICLGSMECGSTMNP